MQQTNRAFKCPYFKYEDKRKNGDRRTVHCEGGSKVVLNDVHLASEHYDFFCCSYNWRHCSIAQSRNAYYAQQEAKEKEKQENGS